MGNPVLQDQFESVPVVDRFQSEQRVPAVLDLLQQDQTQGRGGGTEIRVFFFQLESGSSYMMISVRCPILYNLFFIFAIIAVGAVHPFIHESKPRSSCSGFPLTSSHVLDTRIPTREKGNTQTITLKSGMQRLENMTAGLNPPNILPGYIHMFLAH